MTIVWDSDDESGPIAATKNRPTVLIRPSAQYPRRLRFSDRSRAQALATIVVVVLLAVGGVAPKTAAQTPDQSDVVLVLDVSASILQDKANRNRFGAALERIADRVDATSPKLVGSDTTVTIVQFATRAADYPGCSDLKLFGSPETVAHFADCLRSLATAYRKGLTPALTSRVGVDTNYVAAMEQAAKHLPVGSPRPAMILFTDGKHDVPGVPVSQVQPALQRLFGARSPFALLPVGMGLDPKLRAGLTAGLEGLRVIRDMPACIGSDPLQWPQVVFQTADEAGTAVAAALAAATCTFTAAPTPSPTPAPTPAAVTGIKLTPGDGKIDLTWTPGVAAGASSAPILDYTAHCRPTAGGDWIDSTEGVSPDPKATVQGLANGTVYLCEVAAVGATGPGAWVPAVTTVTPVGRPPAPAKPSVEAFNRALEIHVTPAAGAAVTRYRFECSPDKGASWPNGVDVAADTTTTQIGDLTNGVEYQCRAFAANAVGVSDPSEMSDAVRPCSSLVECNTALLPVVGILGVLLVGGILAAFMVLLRGRTTGHVVAVVDVVHTANIGHGSSLGIAFERAPDSRAVVGIVAEKGRRADIRIRRLRGGRFQVADKVGKKIAADGEPIVVIDSIGVRHGLVLQAFETNAASPVASRR
jgi:hypothetical protein